MLTDYGMLSLNDVLALEVEGDTSDYSNYASYTTAVTNATEYKNSLSSTAFTDYDTQYAEYVSYIESVLEAYYGLEYGFSAIPDGTVTQNDSSSSINLITNDQGYQYVDFTYTNSAIILKMDY